MPGDLLKVGSDDLIHIDSQADTLAGLVKQTHFVQGTPAGFKQMSIMNSNRRVLGKELQGFLVPLVETRRRFSANAEETDHFLSPTDGHADDRMLGKFGQSWLVEVPIAVQADRAPITQHTAGQPHAGNHLCT